MEFVKWRHSQGIIDGEGQKEYRLISFHEGGIMEMKNIILVEVKCEVVARTFNSVIMSYATVLKRMTRRRWLVRNSAYLWELVDCYPEGVVVARTYEGKIS